MHPSLFSILGGRDACGDLDRKRAKPLPSCQRCGVLTLPNRKWCGPCRDEVHDEQLLATRMRKKQRPILTDDAFHGGEPIPAKGN